MKTASVSFIFLVFAFHSAECSKILTFFNFPSKSHNILGLKLAEGLIKRGHYVTMASPFVNPPMENYTQIHLKLIQEYKDHKVDSKITTMGTGLTMFLNILELSNQVTELFWQDPSIQRLIKEKPKYDVIILFALHNDAALGIAHHLGVPSIFFSPIGSTVVGNKYVANPNMVYLQNPLFNMSPETFFGRLFTVTLNGFMEIIGEHLMGRFQEGMLKKNLPNAPSLQDLKKNVSLMLMNSHFSIEPPRPYVPNMIQIGGFHIQEPKELPKDIKSYLDGAKQGAILFCMGSNVLVASFEEEKRRAIFKVLGEMAPMRVLFKSELNHENLPKNIMVSKWLPQTDILGHPNTKVFISHGGLGGNTEAVYHGVPILGIPFFADQKMNMAEAQTAGYATVVSNEDLTEGLFRKKLKEVIENPKYKENAKKRSALIKEQPVKPMDNAAFWIEHIIKYGGGSHLRNAGMDLTWYQLYMVDIFVFYTVLSILVLIFNYYVIKFILRIIKRIFFKGDVKVKTS